MSAATFGEFLYPHLRFFPFLFLFHAHKHDGTAADRYRLSGAVLQPSDVRLKTDISPLDPAQQLSNVCNVRLYRYRLKDEWARSCGRVGEEVCVQ